jgi:molecular chaperone DnaJ
MATMAAKRDYYEVLGVERTAAGKTITEAYRRLAIQFHPDRNPGDDEAIARFKEAAEAYEILSDADKRSRYDRYGHQGLEGSGGGSHFNDVGDIFAAFGNIFGEGLFGDFFGGRRSHKGGDVRVNLKLDLYEAAKGVARNIEFERHETCQRCDGSGAAPGSGMQKCGYCSGRGQVVQSSGIFRVQTTCPACHGAGKLIKDPCGNCRGSGYTLHKVQRTVQIPAGIEDQMRVRLPGEGEPSPQGGPRGDCYCFISVAEHPLFQRQGQDLHVEVPVSYSQAALGAAIEVPTLDGTRELEVPPGTQSGTRFRLRGLGLPHPRRRELGDLFVQVLIDVPRTLSARQKELLRELAELEQVDVSPERTSFLDKVREYFSGRSDGS